jgi:serpin B
MMKMNRICMPVVMLLAFAGGLTSCSSESDDVIVPKGSDVIEENARAVNMLYPEKSIRMTAGQSYMVHRNNLFSLNLFRNISEKDGNKSSFCSPLSVTYVLGMLNAGAVGNTQEEIQDVLGFRGCDSQAINSYCEKLIKTAPQVDPKVTLNIANSIFVNNAIGKIAQPYQQEMERSYEAMVEDMDFRNVRNVDKINGWCKEKTHDMIPTILDDNEFSSRVVMFLLNAIYFKADWAEKFDKKYTQEADFQAPSGKKKVEMMHQKVLAKYGESGDYTSLSLPFGDGDFCMKLLLPKEGKSIDDVLDRLHHEMSGEKSLWPEELQEENCEVDVKVPRWETDSKIPLIDILKKMGIRQVFDPVEAELTKMTERGTLYVSMMKQLAKIEVNETGSKAAAVTVAGVNYTAYIPSEPVEPRKVEFHANRPFVYLITERGSNVVFFMGKYTGE